MVGKIKHVRKKLHHEAVKVDSPVVGPTRPLLAQNVENHAKHSETTSAPVSGTATNKATSLLLQKANNVVSKNEQGLSAFPSGVFAGTEIKPADLVQNLNFGEPPAAVTPIPKKGPEEKNLKSKKDKMKARREIWLNKINSIKRAREEEVAQKRRQSMPVVGDMRPLADALPELSQLLTHATSAACKPRHKNRKNKMPVKKRMEPTDFSLMKQSQKRKLLEAETSRFSEASKCLATKSNPLAEITEHLRKRMRQEEEQGPT